MFDFSQFDPNDYQQWLANLPQQAPQPGPTSGPAPGPDPNQMGPANPGAQVASFANPNGYTAPGLTGNFPAAPSAPVAQSAPTQAPAVDPTTTGSTQQAGILSGVGKALHTNDGTGGPSALGGLLNFKNDDNKNAFIRGMLAAGGALMQAGAPSDHPTNFLGNLGGALATGTSSYDQYKKDQVDNAYKVAQAKTLGVSNATNLFKLGQDQQSANAVKYLYANGTTPSFDGGSSTGATNVPASASAQQTGSNDASGSSASNPLIQLSAERAALDRQYRYLAANSAGNSDVAKAIAAQIDQKDKMAADNGYFWTSSGYQTAPQFTQFAHDKSQAEATGKAEGERNQWTEDQKNYYGGVSDPGFAQSEQQKRDASRQASRYQKNGAFIDPKTNTRYNAFFDTGTGNTVYLDINNQPVTDPAILNRVQEDVPGKNGLTDSQSNSATFLDRASKAAQQYDGANGDTALTGSAGFVTNGVPIVGPVLTDKNYQLASNAKMEIIRALLRKESGAVIGKDEYRDADATYFPQPNDPPEVVAQKRILRQNAIDSLKFNVPDAAMQKIDAGSQAATTPQQSTQAPQQTSAPQAGNNTGTSIASGTLYRAPDGSMRRRR